MDVDHLKYVLSSWFVYLRMTLNLSVGSATMISGNFLRALPPQGSMSLFRSPWGRKALLPVASAAEGQKGVKNQF